MDIRRLVNLLAVGKFVEDCPQRVLNNLKHVVLRGKRHFHIHLIKFARRTVRARVFVAETRRNLKILVKP